MDNFPRIIPNVQRLRIRHSNVKKELFSIFYSKSWGKLSLEEKHKHTVFNCEGCLHKKVFKSALGKFQPSSATHVKKVKTYNLQKEEILKDITNKTVADLDRHFYLTIIYMTW